MDQKATLLRYLTIGRDDLLAKLDGLSDYDVVRPMTPTGTSLLGLVKHTASVQQEYLGSVFDRPSGLAGAWLEDDAEDDSDMWVAPSESRAEIEAFHRASARHADATVEALDLDSPGLVPWWSADRRHVTLQQVLVHLVAETARHAGHADILRELIDGSAGTGPGDPNLPDRTAGDWAAFRDRIERSARER